MVVIGRTPWILACQYGCDPNRKRIKEYARFTGETVEKEQQKIGETVALVPSGGFTDKKFPGISEAMMMETLLRDLGFTFPIYREDAAITTIQNIRFSTKLWVENVQGPNHVDILGQFPRGIVCDKDRAFKIAYIVRCELHKKIPIHGFNFERSLKQRSMIVAGTMKDLVAVHSKTIEGIVLKQTMRKIEASS